MTEHIIFSEFDEEKDIEIEELMKAFITTKQKKRESRERKERHSEIERENHFFGELLGEVKAISENLRDLTKVILCIASGIRVDENEYSEDLENLHNSQISSLDFWDNDVDDIWNDWTGEEE